MTDKKQTTAMTLSSLITPRIRFVCAVSNVQVLSQYLLASPDFDTQDPPVHLIIGAETAASAFNSLANQLNGVTDWLVWVHQDVFLPHGWISLFCQSLRDAQQRWPDLAVAGVYGTTPDHKHVGEVVDRGLLLRGNSVLPAIAHGLDELLVAVRLDTGLRMDSALCWDFYASDLALQASESGFKAAVIFAPCEHWSGTPRQGISSETATRCFQSGKVFLTKWHKLLEQKGRLSTPCIELTCESDLRKVIDMLQVPDDRLAMQHVNLSDQNKQMISPATLNNSVAQASKRIEACWISSDWELPTSPDIYLLPFTRFYGSCGVNRFWHIEKFASLQLVDAVSLAFNRCWLLLLRVNHNGDFESVIEVIDEIKKKNMEMAKKLITESSPTHNHQIYRVQVKPIETVDSVGLNFEQNARSSTYLQDSQLLPPNTSKNRKFHEHALCFNSNSYWLVEPNKWLTSAWQLTFAALVSKGPRGESQTINIDFVDIFKHRQGRSYNIVYPD